MAPPRLEFKGIEKRFGDVVANDGVSFAVEAGTIHALLGENGAGKTTLMRLAYGLEQPDAGTITVDGREVEVESPRTAMDLGIGMVQQHFALVPTLTVTENVILGDEPGGRLPVANRRHGAEIITSLSRTYDLDVDPHAVIEDLSAGEKQRVELIKLLHRDPSTVILDEPTSLLAPPEIAQLLRVMNQWTAEGCGVVFITHKLVEAIEIADRITVMRKGRIVGSRVRGEADERELTRLMVGLDAVSTSAQGVRIRGGVDVGVDHVLRSKDLVAASDRGHTALQGLSIELHPREIVGLAGVEGNGQRELGEVIAGIREWVGGTLELFGSEVKALTPARAAELGIGLIPEDRRGAGLILELSVLENLLLRPDDRMPFQRRGVLDGAGLESVAAELLEEYDIDAGGLSTPAWALSGGNQQKVVLARELRRSPKMLVAAQPTQGLDIRASAYVHQKVREQRDRGAAVLYVSTDLDEILQVSDRVAVIYRGRIVDEVSSADADRERIGLFMAGVRDFHPEQT